MQPNIHSNTNSTSKSHLNLKLDTQLRQQAQQLAEEVGLPLSAIIVLQLKDFVRSRSLLISALPHLNPSVEAAAIEKVADYEKGIKISPILHTPSAIAPYLRKSCS